MIVSLAIGALYQRWRTSALRLTGPRGP